MNFEERLPEWLTNINIVSHTGYRHGNKECCMCRGEGYYSAINVGEHEEMLMSVKCSCTNKTGRNE